MKLSHHPHAFRPAPGLLNASAPAPAALYAGVAVVTVYHVPGDESRGIVSS